MRIAIFLFCFFNTASLFATRESSTPFISGDTFRHYAQHIFDETTLNFAPEKVKRGDVVFVKTDPEYLGRFFKEFHPRILEAYILLTHNADYAIPRPYEKMLDDQKILAWFGQNVEDFSHPKLHPIPLGVANSHWPHGDVMTFLSMLSYASRKERSIFVYMNFTPGTHFKERSYVWNLFSKYPWVVSSPIKSFKEYLLDVSHARFVLSPRGNGLDCHRTWEALLMGAIPIVKSSAIDTLFEDLPVLIVNNWEEVTEEYLKKVARDFALKKFNREKLFIHYWISTIEASRTR